MNSIVKPSAAPKFQSSFPNSQQQQTPKNLQQSLSQGQLKIQQQPQPNQIQQISTPQQIQNSAQYEQHYSSLQKQLSIPSSSSQHNYQQIRPASPPPSIPQMTNNLSPSMKISGGGQRATSPTRSFQFQQQLVPQLQQPNYHQQRQPLPQTFPNQPNFNAIQKPIPYNILPGNLPPSQNILSSANKNNILNNPLNQTALQLSPTSQISSLSQRQILSNNNSERKQAPRIQTVPSAHQVKADQRNYQNSNPQQQQVIPEEINTRMNQMDSKMSNLVEQINQLQVLVIKKNKEAKYWKNKYDAIDNNLASFLSDNDHDKSKKIDQKNNHAVEQEYEEEGGGGYSSKPKRSAKELEQFVLEQQALHKEQINSLQSLLKQKDEYLEQYAKLNEELLKKIERLSAQNNQTNSFSQRKSVLAEQQILKTQELTDSRSRNSVSRKRQSFDDNYGILSTRIKMIESDLSLQQGANKSLLAENEQLKARLESIQKQKAEKNKHELSPDEGILVKKTQELSLHFNNQNSKAINSNNNNVNTINSNNNSEIRESFKFENIKPITLLTPPFQVNQTSFDQLTQTKHQSQSFSLPIQQFQLVSTLTTVSDSNNNNNNFNSLQNKQTFSQLSNISPYETLKTENIQNNKEREVIQNEINFNSLLKVEQKNENNNDSSKQTLKERINHFASFVSSLQSQVPEKRQEQQFDQLDNKENGFSSNPLNQQTNYTNLQDKGQGYKFDLSQL